MRSFSPKRYTEFSGFFCLSGFINNFFCGEQFLGTEKLPKVKYLKLEGFFFFKKKGKKKFNVLELFSRQQNH